MVDTSDKCALYGPRNVLHTRTQGFLKVDIYTVTQSTQLIQTQTNGHMLDYIRQGQQYCPPYTRKPAEGVSSSENTILTHPEDAL